MYRRTWARVVHSVMNSNNMACFDSSSYAITYFVSDCPLTIKYDTSRIPIEDTRRKLRARSAQPGQTRTDNEGMSAQVSTHPSVQCRLQRLQPPGRLGHARRPLPCSVGANSGRLANGINWRGSCSKSLVHCFNLLDQRHQDAEKHREAGLIDIRISSGRSTFGEGCASAHLWSCFGSRECPYEDQSALDRWC